MIAFHFDWPFQTRADFHAWLETHGLMHVGRQNLECVAACLDARWWPQLHALGAKRRLSEFASAEGMLRAKAWISSEELSSALGLATQQYVKTEWQQAKLAKSQEAQKWVLPTHSNAKEVFQKLLETRKRIPASVAGRPIESLDVNSIHFNKKLAAFEYVDPFPSERPLHRGGAFGKSHVTLGIKEESFHHQCSCVDAPCVHVLATIDTALLALQQNKIDSQVLDELLVPTWKRTLWQLQASFHAPAVVPPASISFRMRFDSGQAYVAAFIAGKKCTRRDLLEYPGSLSEKRVAALFPNEGSAASLSLLQTFLLEKQSLFLESNPEQSVQIESVNVGLVAEERAGGVSVQLGIDGAALSAFEIQRLQKAAPDEAVFLWDEGPRRLTLLQMNADLKSASAVLKKSNSLFPIESHTALLQTLSQWATRVPVVMPRSVVGERVLPQMNFVVRVQVRPGGWVEFEFLVRPLADSHPMTPGLGAKDVHVRRADKAIHAVRDLKSEVSAVKALVASLPLENAEVSQMNEYLFSLQKIDEVFAVLEACQKYSHPPELEWIGAALTNAGVAGARALSVKLEQNEEWFGVLGELNVFGERVELARLIEAARKKSRFIQVSTHSYIEIQEVLRRELEKLGDHSHRTKNALLLSPSVIPALQSLDALGAKIDGDEKLESLSARLKTANALKVKKPTLLNGELRPYQMDGVEWLTRLAHWGASGILADDMGLGKTVQAICVLLNRASKGPALIVAPTSVAFNWSDELKKFAPSLQVHVLSEGTKRSEVMDALGANDVLVISYHLLVREIVRLGKREFVTVVFDEAQNLKNAGTQRYRAAKSLKGAFRFALTGTPIENNLSELWSLFSLVFPSLFGSWERFRERFATPIEKQIDPAASAALSRVIEPYLLRRKKSQVASELPERTEVRVSVVLSSAEHQLYEDARLAALSDLETPKKVLKEQERKVQVLALLTRLRLAACHPKLYDSKSTVASSKLARLVELAQELKAQGQRILIFSQFTSHLALAQAALRERDISLLYLDGSTPALRRKECVYAFQNGNATAFLISLKAGGVGLNLTAATSVIHLDPWWNPAVEDQASDRAHRIGQRLPVTVYRLIAMHTVEEKMLALHARKRALVEKVLQGQSNVGAVGIEELVSLFESR
jgi:superfamily II DNA or RNA helicase